MTRPKGYGPLESGLPRAASKSRHPGLSSRLCFSPDRRTCTTSHQTVSAYRGRLAAWRQGAQGSSAINIVSDWPAGLKK